MKGGHKKPKAAKAKISSGASAPLYSHTISDAPILDIDPEVKEELIRLSTVDGRMLRLAEISVELAMCHSDVKQKSLATQLRVIERAHSMLGDDERQKLSKNLVDEIAEDNRLKRSMSGASAAFDNLPAIPSADGGGTN